MLIFESFSDSEVSLIKTVKKDNRSVFAKLLYFYKINLRFPGYNEDLNLNINQICKDFSITDIEYANINNSRSIRRHKETIRKALNYKKHTNKTLEILTKHLNADIFPWILNKEQIQLAVFEYHLKEKIEIYEPLQLETYLDKSYNKFEQHLFQQINLTLGKTEKRFLDQITNYGSLINEKGDFDDKIKLNQLKQDIPGVKLKNVNTAIEKYQELKNIELPEELIAQYSRKIILRYYERVKVYYPSHINSLSNQSRYALLAIFCHIRKERLADNLIELFSRLIKRIENRSKNFVKNTLVHEIKKVDGKFEILLKLTNIALDKPDGVIKDTIYPEVSKELLEALALDLSHRGNWYQKQIRNKMCQLYSMGNRKEILKLIMLFNFEGENSSDMEILSAISLIRENADSATQNYIINSAELDSIIPENWRDLASDIGQGLKQIRKSFFELSVSSTLKKKLAYKGIWAQHAYRYRSPEKDIPVYVLKNEDILCKEIDLSKDTDALISSLKTSLDSALRMLNNNISHNDKVSIGKDGHIKITPFVAQDTPEHSSIIPQEILKRWGHINLIDAFKEASFRVGFTQRFVSIGKYSNMAEDNLIMKLLLTLYAIGSNTGLKRISAANPTINESDLKYIKLRYINSSNIRLAITDVVNEVIRIRDPRIWGKATTSVACDSKKIAAWDQNLLTQWHPRYKGSGVMVYWHVDTNALCVYSQSKTCLSSEVASMMKGVFEHSTAMELDTAYVDTHGQSTIGFGVGRLLNFNIFPRLKNIHEQKLYVSSKQDKTKFSNLGNIIKDNINWKSIEVGYKKSIPYLISLKKGLLEPEVFVKRFSKDNYSDSVYKALCEIGKVEKTIFLCRYISDEKFRIEINAGLNIVERLNSVMNFFFYGKVSGIHSNDPEEQELSILCLHLLQVCAVYINTLLIQEIFGSLSLHNSFKDEDYRALSPLICSHFNPYGIFILDLKDRIIINQRG